MCRASPEWPASQLQSQILHLLLLWDKEVLGLNSRLFTRKQGVVAAWSPGGLWLLPASVGNPSLSMAWTSSTRESEHRKKPRYLQTSPAKAGVAAWQERKPGWI